MTAHESVDALFSLQHHSYQQAPTRTRDRRRALLLSLKEMVLCHAEAMKDALARDFRKPAAEVELAEIGPVIGEVDFALANLDTWFAGQEVPTPPVEVFASSVSRIAFEPKGVCLIIAPWNYPFALMLGPLASCLAAGNRAILKPSEHTPHASALLETMVRSTFAVEDVAVVQGDARTAAALLAKPFHHVFFTGGTEIGKLVMTQAARHLSSCTLELGGKSPLIVDETADLDLAAAKIAWGKTFNAGQTCIAPDYVLVHESVKVSLLTRVQAALDQLYGNSEAVTSGSAGYAAIVNDAHFGRLTDWIDEAVERGARVARGNTRDARSRVITPTVLTDVPADTRLMREEIFGPVIPVGTYRQLSDVLGELRSRPKPLALYLFSRDEEHIRQVLEGSTAGGTCINDVLVHFFSPFLPFGGANSSGMGRAHGFHGFREFSNERAILRSAVSTALAAQ